MIRRLFTYQALLIAPVVFGQSAPIVIDGCFDDWTPGLATFNDLPESISGIDILSMQVSNDADHLFIKVDFNTEIDLIEDEVPHNLYLYLDTDNNAGTGFVPQAGFGAEIGIDLSGRTAFYNVTPFSVVDLHSFGYVQGPTTTGTTFEVSLDRNAIPDGVNPLFPGPSTKILFREPGVDEMPNPGNAFLYTFDNTAVPFGMYTVPKDDVNDIRIVAYNIFQDGMIDAARVPAIERVITALDADIIGISEAYSTTAATVKTLLDTWLPLGTANGWYVLKDDFELITASRWPIIGSWPVVTRQFPTLIDLPPSYPTDLLFTNAHLNCCGNDAARQAQVDEYAAFILDAKSPGGVIDLPTNTPFVYGGDLNFVGTQDQLITLLSGAIDDVVTWGPGAPLDWDNTDVTDTKARQSNAPQTYTWQNTGIDYPPGRLDFIIYSDAVITAEKSFVLNTANMTPAELIANGLVLWDTGFSSDHLPVVADFAMNPVDLQLNVKTFLQGPFDGLNMDDNLRSRGILPSVEPYTGLGFTQIGGGGEEVIGSVFGTLGSDAVVDWVLLELRSATINSNIVATRSALIQRDGDIVDLDGTSPVSFSALAGLYHVAVRHRNHLGVMTGSPVFISTTTSTVDFSVASTGVYGTQPLVNVAGTLCMWSGNVIVDDQLKYVGGSNDRDGILLTVGGAIPTNTVSDIYTTSDVNLDGDIKYTGVNNDRDPILVNVGGSVPTNTRQEQLP